jgi:ABC-type uncharacterized transport system permease subunit
VERRKQPEIKKGGGGAAARRRRLSFLGLGFFLLFFVVKITPQVWLKMKAIYRQNSFFGLQNWSLKFCVWPLISINSLGKKLNWVS